MIEKLNVNEFPHFPNNRTDDAAVLAMKINKLIDQSNRQDEAIRHLALDIEVGNIQTSEVIYAILSPNQSK